MRAEEMLVPVPFASGTPVLRRFHVTGAVDAEQAAAAEKIPAIGTPMKGYRQFAVTKQTVTPLHSMPGTFQVEVFYERVKADE